MESSRITTSFLCSTRRLAFSITISATCTWRVAGSSKAEATTSPLTVRLISVTSSGRSSMSSTMRTASGWFAVMAWGMCCMSTVLQHLEGRVAEHRLALLGLVLEEGEHELLLAEPVGAFELVDARHFDELGDGFELEVG